MRNNLQEYMIKNYRAAINDETFNERTYRSYIAQYIKQSHFTYKGMTSNQLVDYFYNELREYSVITPYLDDPTIEEININSWEDIKLHYSDGRVEKCPYNFHSPVDAQDVISKMLRKQKFGNCLDNDTPIVRGHLSKNKRITASISPILDKDRGIQGNIRMINPQRFEKKDFIEKETATEEIYDFLLGCFQCGLSTVFIGPTNTGKTTMMSSLLRLLPKNKRLITIENEVREFDLIKRNDKNEIINSIIHWVTTQKYDQEKLLEYSLTCNPDYICLAEMKSEEAFAVTEASRTGHAVTTTIHANSCRAAYTRMTTLCQLKGLDIKHEILYQLCIESFPIAVMMKQLDDNSRKIVEITESYLDDQQNPVIRTLFRYQTTHRIQKNDGTIELKGKFIRVNEISDHLKQHFMEMGYNIEFLKQNQIKKEKTNNSTKKVSKTPIKPKSKQELKVEGF